MRVAWALVAVVTCMTMSEAVGLFGGWWGGWWRGRGGRWWCSRRRNGYSPPVSTPRLSDVRTIVGTCQADLGRCPVGECHTNSALPSKCKKDGYICPVTEAINVTCGALGTFQVNNVTACTCCKDRGIVLNVRVKSAEDQSPLAGMTVETANERRSTNAGGEFITRIATGTLKVVVEVTDPTGEFMYSIRVEEIPKDFRGPVVVDIAMVKKAEPVSFNARDDTTLSISSDPSNPNAGPARIRINRNSFWRGWRKYTGTVKASLTFLNVSDATTGSLLPGRFRTDAGVDLISDGVFSLEFTDSAGRALRTPWVTVEVDNGMRLWRLSTAGLWQSIGIVTGRKKRQATFDSISARIPRAVWINIDKIPQTPECFFKARIFDKDTGAEIESSTSVKFMPRAATFEDRTPLRRLGTYFSPTSTPAQTCYRIRCSTASTRLFGFINMTSYENIDIGGTTVREVKVLSPRPLAQYSTAIQDAHTSVRYEVVNLDTFANYIINTTGPFYSDRDSCENSSANEPAFHFMKPPISAYVPAPENTTKCVARLGFFESRGNFSDIVNALDTSVKVTALSVWEGPDGTNQYLTSKAYLQNTGNGTFFVACVEYRCSDVAAATTVYISIDVPTVSSNGTATPAFTCYKSCQYEDCPPQLGRRRRDTSSTSLGSFTAPQNVTNGPDFYADPDNSDCADRSENEAFAARFYCFTRSDSTLQV